jgi:hypothetical protein
MHVLRPSFPRDDVNRAWRGQSQLAAIAGPERAACASPEYEWSEWPLLAFTNTPPISSTLPEFFLQVTELIAETGSL